MKLNYNTPNQHLSFVEFREIKPSMKTQQKIIVLFEQVIIQNVARFTTPLFGFRQERLKIFVLPDYMQLLSTSHFLQN